MSLLMCDWQLSDLSVVLKNAQTVYLAEFLNFFSSEEEKRCLYAAWISAKAQYKANRAGELD